MIPWKYAFLTMALSSTFYTAPAQQDKDKNIFTVPEQLSATALAAWKQNLPADGWLILHDAYNDQLLNLSHQDYILRLWLTCTDGKGPAGYLVEYSDHYRDGDFGGLDLVGSRSDDGRIVKFLLDGRDFDNPFLKMDSPQFRNFTLALKQAKRLTVSVYDMEMNPETGKDEQRLNRAIDFKLAHSELLDYPVQCGRGD